MVLSCLCGVCRRAGCLGPCTGRQPHDPRDRHYPLRTPLDYCPRAFTLDGLPCAPDPEGMSPCAVSVCAVALEYCLARRGVCNFHASRLFVHYNTRKFVLKRERLNSDSGCTVRDVCKAVSKFGACEERLWPYNRGTLNRRPPTHLYAAARRIPPCTYARVPQSLPHIVACLLQHRPIIMGMAIYSNIRSVRGSCDMLDLPGSGDRPLGAHAVLLCGYDLDRGRFMVQNCWGERWGNSTARFEVPHAYVLDQQLCWDLWTLG